MTIFDGNSCTCSIHSPCPQGVRRWFGRCRVCICWDGWQARRPYHTRSIERRIWRIYESRSIPQCATCTLHIECDWPWLHVVWWLCLAWFGFGLAFPLFLLVFPYGSASVFLCFCLWIPLSLRVFLLVSACVSPCFCLGFSLFLRVSSPCVPRCFCLCFSLFLLVLPIFSACVSLCLCLLASLLLVVAFVVACVFASSAWVCLCLLHCFCTSLWLLCFIRLWCWLCFCLLFQTVVQGCAAARLIIVILQALLLLLLSLLSDMSSIK